MSKRTYCSTHVYGGFILRGEGWGVKAVVWYGLVVVCGGEGGRQSFMSHSSETCPLLLMSHVAKSTLYDAQQLYIHINDLCIHRTAQCTWIAGDICSQDWKRCNGDNQNTGIIVAKCTCLWFVALFYCSHVNHTFDSTISGFKLSENALDESHFLQFEI